MTFPLRKIFDRRLLNPVFVAGKLRAKLGQVAHRPAPVPTGFSLSALAGTNPALAAHLGWGSNQLSLPAGKEAWLHFGCGERVFDGFINLDFIPHDSRVQAWDMLYRWPQEYMGTVAGAFSEDVMEHFFYPEQVYILCQINRLLEQGGTYRALMPNLDSLVRFTRNFMPTKGEFLHETFGVDTGNDALNAGMRFSGHRWLHGPESFAHQAAACGFVATETDPAKSSVPKLCNLNLRSGMCFAMDLRKTSTIEFLELMPSSVQGATLVEEAGGTALYRATGTPVVEYALPTPLNAGDITGINVRSANLSNFTEHSLKTLGLAHAGGVATWRLDETLKSRYWMNMITFAQVARITQPHDRVSTLRFTPGAAGDYFTLGSAEIFYKL